MHSQNQNQNQNQNQDNQNYTDTITALSAQLSDAQSVHYIGRAYRLGFTAGTVHQLRITERDADALAASARVVLATYAAPGEPPREQPPREQPQPQPQPDIIREILDAIDAAQSQASCETAQAARYDAIEKILTDAGLR
jgi:hypothetical protein